MSAADFFRGSAVAVATRHGKERVIAPLLKAALGVANVVVPPIDTDSLGTFTGEVERRDGILATLRAKCALAFKASDCRFAVASEGSFGPHPQLYFIPADDEWVMLRDRTGDIEIVARQVSSETNFGGATFHTPEAATDFAHKRLFPSHGLILRAAENDSQHIRKGITDPEALQSGIRDYLGSFGQVHLETDMRAHYNPTRMGVIAAAVQRLVERACLACPQCAMPGFDTVSVQRGLPCRLCNSATESLHYLVKGCAHCGYFEYQFHPEGKQEEEPLYCPSCNP